MTNQTKPAAAGSCCGWFVYQSFPLRGEASGVHPVGAGLCSARRCRFCRKHGRSRAPPLQSANQIKQISPQKGADRQIWSAPSIDSRYSTATSIKSDTSVSGGAYQDAREMSLVWNARPKHCGPPKIKGSMHPASPSTLFSPIFSLAREKIGPPEARQKRPRRNESLQARLLILCARFFLSKPQTEFAVWVLSQICDNLSVSLRLTAPLGGEPWMRNPLLPGAGGG